MNTIRSRLFVGASAVLAALLAGSVPAWAQGQGTVSGRVTDQGSGQPVVGARVNVLGTALRGQTNSEGRYTLSGVPSGPATVRVSAIGYAAATRAVTVTAAETATADFPLTLTAFTLDAIVSTATGDQARREIGNSIASIDAGKRIETQPIASLSELLQGQAAGVQVQTGALTGAEPRIRIRGLNSLSLNNGPIYYIDGVRMEAGGGAATIGIGGTDLSRLNDLNPEEIESMEIVRGPSAATLYGTDAANGVIVIKTKRGRAGAPRWSVYSELGVIKDRNQYPIAYRAWRTGSTSTTNSTRLNGVQCFLSQVAAGTCVQDSVTTFNLFEDPDASPNGTGWRGQLGAQVSGGSDAARYFLSGEYEDELGQLKMPDFAYARVTTARQIAEVPYEQYRPNALRRVSVRGNLQATLNPKMDVAVSTGFTSVASRQPQTDNNTTGLMSNAFGGPGFKDNVRPADGAALYGYRAFTPDEFFSEVVDNNADRFIGSGTMNWRPNSWLSARIVGGLDFTSEVSEDLCRRGECIPGVFGLDFRKGFKGENRATIHRYTLDGNATASYVLRPTLRGRTTAGIQYFERNASENSVFGEDLPAGATTAGAGAIEDAAEATTEAKTLGAFIEQQLTLNERLTLTGALRMDDNSAFGKDFSAVVYPKISASWVLSEEPFFQPPSWLSNLRLRGALGASGNQPGSTDAIFFFAGNTATIDGQDAPAVNFSSLGNAFLKPERAREVELGFEVGFVERVNVDFTYYHKSTKDALVSVPVAPSAGASASRFQNLGSVRNSGIEVTVNATLASLPAFGWDLVVAGSHNTNEIVDLGKDETGRDIPPIIGTTIHQREGYPINSYWLRPVLGYNDVNGNGIVEATEIIVGDSAAFIGPNLPTTEITVTNGFDLLDRKLRIQALFDYKGGRYQLNGTERIRCESRLNCDGLVDPNSPLWKQIRVVALREHPSRTQWGYVEKSNFVRFRELALTYQLPDAWARAMRVDRVSLTAAGRNLHTWTKYSGLDPEAGYFDDDLQTDFQTAPPPTYWTVRVNIGF